MLKMSFYSGTLDIEALTEFIKNTKKKIRYTHGLGYRNPTVNQVVVDKERALEIVEDHSLLDADETIDTLYLNTYSANDMY